MPPRPVPALPRPARGALLAVAAALLLTADDRHAGKVSDGRQTIGTAVAIVETGELGIGKGAPRAFEREADAVSRYGMGASLAQLPAAAAAPAVESAFGPGASQPLFLLAPLAGVLLAAAAAGGIARLAGASTSLQGLAVLFASLGGPLGSYATSDFSEALQAAALAGALLLALGAARESDPRASRRRAFGAGLAAGAALLVKSSLAVVAPALLLPLLAASALRGRRLAAAAAGAVLPVAAWVAFELHRFGRLFSGYEGEGFTHPLPEGLWRLLVGPNRGLVLFFPAVLLAAAALSKALLRQGDAPIRLAAAGSAIAFVALLVTAAAWWAWHGVGGWGPRLLVPAVPFLAPWAALAAEGLGTGGRRAVAVLSVALSLPPLLVHPSLVDTYVANCRRAPLTPGLERQLPALAVGPDDAGRPSVSPESVLAKEPLASPFLLYPWYAAASAPRSAESRAERLARPPWYGRRPGLGPRLVPFPPELADVVAPPLRWSFFGRALGRGAADPASFAVYLASLTEQVGRAHETGRLERGLELARKLARLDPAEGSDALLLESLRLLRRTDAFRAALAALPEERASGPSVLVVRALAARDAGDLSLATRLGEAAAPYFPGTALARDGARPASWPATFAALTRPLAPSA